MLKLNELKQNRAITLVALIITIIVMLILVGVSISVLINSDLIGTAQNAGSRTETAYEQEGSLGGITVGNKNYDSIQDYLDGNGWEIVYSGNEPTTDGQLNVSDEVVFQSAYKYRITLDSDIYKQPIECLAIRVDGAEGYSECALFVIADGEIITFTSMEDIEEFQGNIANYQDLIIVSGLNTNETGSQITATDLEGNPIEMTITKIERKEILSIEMEVISNPVTPTVTNGNTIYTDRNGKKAVIPAGFTVSGVAGEQTIDGGLVIYEIPENGTVDWTNTSINMQESYNQFVWVPVVQNQTIKIKVKSEEEISAIRIGAPNQMITTDKNGNAINPTGKNFEIEINPTINGIYTVAVDVGEHKKAEMVQVTSLYAQHFQAIDKAINETLSEYEEVAAANHMTLEELIATEGSSLAEGAYGLYVSSDEGYSEVQEKIDDSVIAVLETSVNKYGGFYIARYEAGSAEKRVQGDYENLTPVLSKKNQYPYNWIQEDEARTQCENMYSATSTPTITSVTSILTNGAAFERTLNWLIETKAITEAEVTEDSTSWGNYLESEFKFLGKYSIDEGENYTEATTLTDKIKYTTSYKKYLLGTGITEYTKRNNIYDLAGNYAEWTSECINEGRYVIMRGENGVLSGGIYPVEFRFPVATGGFHYNIAFRPALYIK